MGDEDLTFDFEHQLEDVHEPLTALPAGDDGEGTGMQLAVVGARDSEQEAPKEKNYRQTVCAFWLRGMCMKGDSCGFLHKFDPERMPVCRTWMKSGECKEIDCPFKHSLDDVKECNMYKLGFCIYGNHCRYKHTKAQGPPPDPDSVEAAKPREHRDWRKLLGEEGKQGGGHQHGHKRQRGTDMLALPAPQQQQQQQQQQDLQPQMFEQGGGMRQQQQQPQQQAMMGNPGMQGGMGGMGGPDMMGGPDVMDPQQQMQQLAQHGMHNPMQVGMGPGFMGQMGPGFMGQMGPGVMGQMGPGFMGPGPAGFGMPNPAMMSMMLMMGGGGLGPGVPPPPMRQQGAGRGGF